MNVTSLGAGLDRSSILSVRIGILSIQVYRILDRILLETSDAARASSAVATAVAPTPSSAPPPVLLTVAPALVAPAPAGRRHARDEAPGRASGDDRPGRDCNDTKSYRYLPPALNTQENKSR